MKRSDGPVSDSKRQSNALIKLDAGFEQSERADNRSGAAMPNAWRAASSITSDESTKDTLQY